MSLRDELAPRAKRERLFSDSISSSSSVNESLLPGSNDQARKAKVEAYFPDLESIYFACERDQPDHLEKFNKKLHQLTGQNVFREVASFNLPETLNASNIISSIEFDNRGQMVASGGVAKRIKVFNFDQMESANWSCTFPSQEIQARAKISALSWNPYIQQQLAAVDYDGVLSIYDSVTGQAVNRFEEHERRAWSIDYSRSDPTRLATGSDDHRIKIWSLNCRHSRVGTFAPSTQRCAF